MRIRLHIVIAMVLVLAFAAPAAADEPADASADRGATVGSATRDDRSAPSGEGVAPAGAKITTSSIAVERAAVQMSSGQGIRYTISYDGPRPHIDFVIDDTETGCFIRFVDVVDTATEMCAV